MVRPSVALALLVGAASAGPVVAQGGQGAAPTEAAVQPDSVRVRYAGLLTVGYEASRFRPCGDWVPDSLGGVRFYAGQLDLTRPHEALALLDAAEEPERAPPAAPWPARPRPERYVPGERPLAVVLSVRGAGWLVGPVTNGGGVYGGFFPDRYTLRTEEYLEVREATAGECGRGSG